VTQNRCSSLFTLAPGASAGVSGESEFPNTLQGCFFLPAFLRFSYVHFVYFMDKEYAGNIE
jgi:hypothetical protein